MSFQNFVLVVNERGACLEEEASKKFCWENEATVPISPNCSNSNLSLLRLEKIGISFVSHNAKTLLSIFHAHSPTFTLLPPTRIHSHSRHPSASICLWKLFSQICRKLSYGTSCPVLRQLPAFRNLLVNAITFLEYTGMFRRRLPTSLLRNCLRPNRTTMSNWWPFHRSLTISKRRSAQGCRKWRRLMWAPNTVLRSCAVWRRLVLVNVFVDNDHRVL